MIRRPQIRSPRRRFHRPVLSLLLLVGVLAAFPRAGLGQSASPNVVKGWKVDSFKLKGMPSGLDGSLKNGLVLAGQSKLLRTRYPIFYAELLAADLDRTRLYLARNGYPYAEVHAVLEPRPEKERVRVHFHVDPGAAVVIREMGFEQVPPEVEKRVRKSIPLRAGHVFLEEAIETSRGQVVIELQNVGHAHAKVEARTTRLDSTGVRLTFAAEPGKIYYFRDVHSRGAPPDLESLVERTASLEPGTRFSLKALERTRDDLRFLGLFRQVRIITEPVPPDSLDATVEVSERPPRTLEGAVGYWTDDGLRVRASWTHRNLFRKGRGAEIGAHYYQYEQEGRIGVWWTAVPIPRSRLSVTAAIRHEDEANYESLGYGLETALFFRQSVRTSYRVAILVSQLDLLDQSPDFDEDEITAGFLPVLSGDWFNDATDDRIDPHRGTSAWLHLEWSPAIAFSDNPYGLGETTVSGYLRPLYRTVLAGRITLGFAEPLGESNRIIPNKRFYSGGASSHRGFHRRRLGPMDVNNDPVGGEVKFEASGEVRFPIHSPIRGAIFVDVGQVWETRDNVELGDLKVGMGPAVMITTPVGPLRADLGFLLSNTVSDEPRTVFHFSIGHSF